MRTLSIGFMLLMTASAPLAQNDYNAIIHRNIAYNDFMHRSVAESRLTVSSNPNDANAQEQLGLALYTSRWRLVRDNLYTTPAPAAFQEEALTHLEKAVSLQPNQIQWQVSLGLFLNSSGHFQNAVPHLQNCLSLLRATNPFKAQQPKNPLAQDQLLFRHDPQAMLVLSSLGNALIHTGRRTEARAVWKRIIALGPGRGSYTMQAYHNLKKYSATHDR